MKSALRLGFRTGAVNAVIVIFLQVIAFLFTLAVMIEKVFTGKEDITAPAIWSSALVLGIISVWAGWSTLSKRNEDQSLGWITVTGLAEGVCAGLITAVYAYAIGSSYANGGDLRTYLSMLSLEVVNSFLLGFSPIVGAAAVFGLQAVGGVLGALLHRVIRQNQPRIKSVAQKMNQSLIHHPSMEGLRKAPAMRWVVLVVVAAGAILLPRVWGAYWNFTIGTVCIYILLGLGMNIIVGLSGQLVLGYVAYFAFGAYTFALLTSPQPHGIQLNFWVALAAAVVVSTLVGILIGLPIMRLRGDYLAIVTLGFGEIVRILLKSDLLTPFTSGPSGLRNIAGPTLFGKPFSSDVDFTYLLLAAVFLGLFVANRLQNSRVGRAWLSIREDETVARASGVDTTKYKLLALALGAAFAGVGGALFASRNQFTGPEDYIMMVSINVLCMVIVGGMGSIPGVILGAFVLKGLPEVLRDLSSYRLLVFSALLVIMMIIRPDGLVPARRPRLESDSSQLQPVEE